MVVDDLQWCDVETLEFLHFLLRFAPRPRPCWWSATAREEEVGSDPLTSLVGGLRALDAVVELRLGSAGPAGGPGLG